MLDLVASKIIDWVSNNYSIAFPCQHDQFCFLFALRFCKIDRDACVSFFASSITCFAKQTSEKYQLLFWRFLSFFELNQIIAMMLHILFRCKMYGFWSAVRKIMPQWLVCLGHLNWIGLYNCPKSYSDQTGLSKTYFQNIFPKYIVKILFSGRCYYWIFWHLTSSKNVCLH